MSKIVVLFNLKDGASREQYEAWAKTVDLPTVNALASIEQFSVFRTTGTLAGGDAPYQYIEILDVKDMAALGQDVAGELMQRVSAQFREFAIDPVFILTEAL